MSMGEINLQQEQDQDRMHIPAFSYRSVMSVTIWIGGELPNSMGGIDLEQQQQQQQQQNLIHIPVYLALVTFIVPVLINLIDLKFQKGSDSVFEVHPATTMVAVVSLLTFFISFAVVLTMNICRRRPLNNIYPRFGAVLHTTVVLSGSLSLASLASLLLPDALRPFLYACCGLLSLGYSLSLLVITTRHSQGWFPQRIKIGLRNLLSSIRDLAGRPPPVLPTEIRNTES